MDIRLKSLNDAWATLTESERLAIYHTVMMTAGGMQALKNQRPPRAWVFTDDDRRAVCFIPNPQRRAGELCPAKLPRFVGG